MKNLLNRFVRDEQGQDLIEYALLAGFISLVAVAAITAVGTGVNDVYEDLNTQVDKHPWLARGSGGGIAPPELFSGFTIAGAITEMAPIMGKEGHNEAANLPSASRRIGTRFDRVRDAGGVYLVDRDGLYYFDRDHDQRMVCRLCGAD